MLSGLRHSPFGMVLLVAGVAAIAGAATIILTNADLGTEADLGALPPEQALEELGRRDKPLSPPLAFLWAQRLAEDGQTEQSSAVLDRLAARSEPTEAILSARADLALRSGQNAAALDLLQRADTIQLDPDRLRKRVVLARDLGDRAAERAALEALGPAQMTGAEALRLADLLAWADASEPLIALAATRVSLMQEDRQAMAVRLAIAAISSGATGRLGSAIATWVRMGTAEELMAAILPVLAAAPSQARVLAYQISSYDPTLIPFLIMNYSRAGLHGVTRGLVSQHLAGREALTAQDWLVLATHADFSGDLSFLEHRMISLEIGAAVPLEVFEPIIRYHGIEGLTKWRTHLADRDLGGHPLIAAAWHGLFQRYDTAAEALIQAARSGGDMSKRDRELWRSLAQGLAQSGQWQRLRVLSQTDPDLARMFSEGAE